MGGLRGLLGRSLGPGAAVRVEAPGSSRNVAILDLTSQHAWTGEGSSSVLLGGKFNENVFLPPFAAVGMGGGRLGSANDFKLGQMTSEHSLISERS